MDYSSGPDDEITIDPLATPNIRIPKSWLLAAAVAAAVVVIGALKLAGVIWTSAPPRWVPALGTGVTVTEPGQVAPGHGSPGAAVAGALAALSSKDPAALCEYAFASASSVAQCKAQLSQASRDQAGYVASVKISYVATDGTHALVGITGKICPPGNKPQCITNADPSAIFSTGNTFTALWAQTLNPTGPSNAYTLLPCAEVGGKWYFGPEPIQSDS